MKRMSALVAVILAVGIVVGFWSLTFSAIWALVHHDLEPARIVAVTQVLTGWGGGMLGILGAFVGYTFGVGKDGHDINKG